jgi:hypothetical protein
MATGIRGVTGKILMALLIAVVLIQFLRPVKNINTTVSAQDINQLYPVPDSVMQILVKACYDCHSDNTRYPWYFNMQPVAWWMNDHITDAKRELNFSEFGKRPLAKQAKKLKKSAKEIQEGTMPLDSYTWIHKDAILTEAEKQLLINWANNLSQQISKLADTAKSAKS